MYTRTDEMLKEMQNWTLYQKIDHSVEIIDEFYKKVKEPTIAFSGGKDSTVLMHLVRNVMKLNIPAIFINTGNEYPEIVKFATKKYNNVTVIKPDTTIKKIIEKYGFPLISKEIAKKVQEIRRGSKRKEQYLTGKKENGLTTKFIIPKKHQHLINEQFSCSPECCTFLKKKPTKNINCITAEMGDESTLRTKAWIRSGCNIFRGTEYNNKSKPLSIWTTKDIWQYKKEFNLEFCEIYNDIRIRRTGCMICGFGITHDKINRFEIIYEKYRKIYEYYMKIENNGIKYETALKKCGIILPHCEGYQNRLL